MSAYGLHALEVDHVQESRTGTNKALVDVQDRQLIGAPPAPLPIGVRPELIRQSAARKTRRVKKPNGSFQKRLESSALTTDQMLSKDEQND